MSRNLDKNAFTMDTARLLAGVGPVKKKPLFAKALIVSLLCVAIAEGCFVKLVQANPYRFHEVVDPPAGSTPLAVSVSSPKNNTVYDVNDIAVAFNVSTKGTSVSSIYGIYFEASWIEDKVLAYKQNSHSPGFHSFWSYGETFWDLPDGEYSITITARGGGGYAEGMTLYSYSMTTISVVNFTVATPPAVSVISPMNMTYGSSDVKLNFIVNKEPSVLKYSLDGQEPSIFYGNTTLTGLANGEHNVTIYVWDASGNLGVSECISFNVAKPESFPTSFAITPIASVVVVGVGIMVYFRRHKS